MPRKCLLLTLPPGCFVFLRCTKLQLRAQSLVVTASSAALDYGELLQGRVTLTEAGEGRVRGQCLVGPSRTETKNIHEAGRKGEIGWTQQTKCEECMRFGTTTIWNHDANDSRSTLRFPPKYHQKRKITNKIGGTSAHFLYLSSGFILFILHRPSLGLWGPRPRWPKDRQKRFSMPRSLEISWFIHRWDSRGLRVSVENVSVGIQQSIFLRAWL